MKTNESTIDRAVRIIIAIVIGIVIGAKVITGTMAIVAGIAAGVLFLTGAIGFCAIYAVLGISTCPVKKKG